MNGAARSLLLALAMVGITSRASMAQNATASAIAHMTASTDSLVAPGARVRFTVTDVQSPDAWESRRLLVKGTVTDRRRDSLVVLLGGGAQMTVSRLAVGDLAVSRGLQPGWKARPRSTALGTALLAANAVLFARALNGPSAQVTGRSSAYLPLGGLLTLNAYVVARQAFGKTERWEPVAR